MKTVTHFRKTVETGVDPRLRSLTLKALTCFNILTFTLIKRYGFNIYICIFDTIFISDEPEGQEERQRHYHAQEKLSYITNYLEQTKDTDVYSESTDDDSGKPGSSSAPSEFGFEETSGMTVN